MVHLGQNMLKPRAGYLQFSFLTVLCCFTLFDHKTLRLVVSCLVYFVTCLRILSNRHESPYGSIQWAQKTGNATPNVARGRRKIPWPMAAGITVPYDNLGLQTADLINNQWPLRFGEAVGEEICLKKGG